MNGNKLIEKFHYSAIKFLSDYNYQTITFSSFRHPHYISFIFTNIEKDEAYELRYGYRISKNHNFYDDIKGLFLHSAIAEGGGLIHDL